MMFARRFCFAVASHRDYRSLQWLIWYFQQWAQQAANQTLQVVVIEREADPISRGLAERVRSDGFDVAVEVRATGNGQGSASAARANAQLFEGIGQAFEQLEPDFVVLLGDRVESLIAACAASAAGLLIAHIGGGELSPNSQADARRHAITKMSHIHFVAADAFRDRVLQLGEAPDRVFRVGAPRLDYLHMDSPPDRGSLAEYLGAPLERPFVLVRHHPLNGAAGMEEILAALAGIDEADIVLAPVDAAADVCARFEAFASEGRKGVVVARHLDDQMLAGAVKNAAVLVGNSCWGLIEAPSLRTPTVNIGSRQDGRLRSASVIDCADDRAPIVWAIRKALNPTIQALLATQKVAYGEAGQVSGWIFKRLTETPLEGLSAKPFFDASVVEATRDIEPSRGRA